MATCTMSTASTAMRRRASIATSTATGHSMATNAIVDGQKRVPSHARFREYYEMHPQGAPPLMVVDMSKPRPFVLDTSLAELADVIPY